jgi:hypothetical protein
LSSPVGAGTLFLSIGFYPAKITPTNKPVITFEDMNYDSKGGIAVLFTARGVEYAENRPFYWQIWRFAVSSAVKIFY